MEHDRLCPYAVTCPIPIQDLDERHDNGHSLNWPCWSCEESCECDLIARVREDERDCDAHGDTITVTLMETLFVTDASTTSKAASRYRCQHYQQGCKDGYAAGLRDAKAAVMAVPRGGWGLKVHEHYRNCIAAVESLGGER